MMSTGDGLTSAAQRRGCNAPAGRDSGRCFDRPRPRERSRRDPGASVSVATGTNRSIAGDQASARPRVRAAPGGRRRRSQSALAGFAHFAMAMRSLNVWRCQRVPWRRAGVCGVLRRRWRRIRTCPDGMGGGCRRGGGGVGGGWDPKPGGNPNQRVGRAGTAAGELSRVPTHSSFGKAAWTMLVANSYHQLRRSCSL